jgi:hypothetical protein
MMSFLNERAIEGAKEDDICAELLLRTRTHARESDSE